MEYILCRFESGYTGDFYQEVLSGNLVRMTDMGGNTLVLPGCGEEGFIPYCAIVINVNTPRPAWAV